MKLSEQLIEIVEHEARGAIDTLRHLTPLGHIESTLTAAAESLTQLESTNAALTKRVAELENEKAEVSEYAEELAAMVGDLQFQLAWTPVSAGLPTEPGVYEFTDGHWANVHAWKLENDVWWYWTDGGRVRWSPMLCWHYTNYRRVELPKDGET